MKLSLILCALVLSMNGWCANGLPSERTTLIHQTIERDMQLQNDSMKTALIASCLLTYFIIIIWWVISAKSSLDKTLKDVLEDIAQHR